MYPLWNLWAGGYSEKYSQVTIDTAGTGSGTGISDASNGTADIGASDAYLPPSDLTANPDLLNIPLAISAQLIAYNVPGVTAHIKLTGKILAEIYQGKITSWNNSAITAINSGVTLPATPIVTLHRSDSSGDSVLFTQFLNKAAPNDWPAALVATQPAWPNASGALGEVGNSGMVSGCKATPGCVAYIGISYLTQALQSGLGYAQLQNAKGNYVLPTNAAIADEAAAFVNSTPANGTISLIYSGRTATGYPIVNYEYAIVSTHQSSSTTAKAIRSVLEWANSANGGNTVSYMAQVNFEPLPAKVRVQSQKQILKIS